MKPAEPFHPLAALRRFTDARIGLGRAGAGLPTTAHLALREAHARARDAVHAAFNDKAIAALLAEAGHDWRRVASQAPDRATYLRRPDLGRRLSEASQRDLGEAATGSVDLAVVIGDGLSAHAVNTHGATTALAVLARLPDEWSVAPVILAAGARVALGDPIGEALSARAVLVLIGERPGLSASDSLGAYFTHAPRTGLTDADRNCVSNIRTGGLAPDRAAETIAALMIRARALGFSGIRLKDDETRLARDERPAVG